MTIVKLIALHLLLLGICLARANGNADSYKVCGTGKVCLPSNLCINGKVNKYGNLLIDIRATNYSTDQSSGAMVSKSTDSNECSLLETCCSANGEEETIKSVPNPVFETRFSADDADSELPVRPEGVPPGCGYQNAQGVALKIQSDDDNEAYFAEFPWMVVILTQETSRGQVYNVYQCGGSLLTPTVVLTGAVCVQGRSTTSLTIRAGEWDATSTNEAIPHQDRKAEEIIVHENYNKGNLQNDIALLILSTPFDLAPNVNTICLPPSGYNFDTSRCYTTGWGKDSFDEGRYQTILKKIELPVVPNSKCQTNLRQTRLGKYFELHSSFMCAGGEPEKDACKGDGGSPLVCPIANSPNRFYQAGIVAWGIGCGKENIPGVYASVSQLRGWIDEQLAYKRIGSAYFTV